MRRRTGFVGLAFPFVGGLLFACASSQTTTRTAEDKVGEGVEYGQPEDTTYVAELDVGREYGNVTIYRKSTCSVIPVAVMQRYKETLRGDRVIERSPLTKAQVPGEPTGTVACDQTYARDVEVLLEADGGRFSLGKTSAEGRVSANLAEVFKVGSYDELPKEAKILLRPDKGQSTFEVGAMSLAQLKKLEERVTQLLAQLSGILDKGASGATPEEITRSYEIYNQLTDLAGEDPRVRAISARFWELFEARKKDEAVEQLGKNLDALKKAQSTLQVMGAAAIPIYVQVAINSGVVDRRALEWSNLTVHRALRRSPAACTAGFSFGGVSTYGWSKDAQLAAHYVHYAYGPAHSVALQHACTTI